MNYKPDESTLISYLYGELGAQENEKVQKYLQEHPEAAHQLRDMANVLNVLGKVEDKEVIAPPVFVDEEYRSPSTWFNSYVKTAMGIAASFLFLIVVAKFLGTEINYSKGELRISFGDSEGKQSGEPLLSMEEVQKMIDSSLARNNESIATNWSDNQQKLEHAIQNNLDLSSQKIDGLIKNASQASQQQIGDFVTHLQNENVKTMSQYLELSASEQNKYLESLLVDFTKYLNEQRNQDLQLFQIRMSTMEQSTDQFKQETEQILASIISSGGSKSQSSSY
jgi:hypothetical protein